MGGLALMMALVAPVAAGGQAPAACSDPQQLPANLTLNFLTPQEADARVTLAAPPGGMTRLSQALRLGGPCAAALTDYAGARLTFESGLVVWIENRGGQVQLRSMAERSQRALPKAAQSPPWGERELLEAGDAGSRQWKGEVYRDRYSLWRDDGRTVLAIQSESPNRPPTIPLALVTSRQRLWGVSMLGAPDAPGGNFSLSQADDEGVVLLNVGWSPQWE